MKEPIYNVHELVSESYAELGLKIKHHWTSLETKVKVVDSHLYFDKYARKVYYFAVTRELSLWENFQEDVYEVTLKKPAKLWTRLRSIFK